MKYNYAFKDIYCNKAEIQKRMTFSALFVMAYEQMVHEWREMLRDFLVQPFVDIGEFQDDLNKESVFYKQYGKASRLFDWFYNNDMINHEQRLLLDKVSERRNQYVHEYTLLTNPIQEDDQKLFRELIDIRKTISRSWWLMIEIPTNPPEENAKFFDENGCFIPPTDAYNVGDLLFDIMINTAIEEK